MDGDGDGQMQMGKKEAGMEVVWGRRRAAPPLKEDGDEVERSRATKAKNDPLSVYGIQPPLFLPFSACQEPRFAWRCICWTYRWIIERLLVFVEATLLKLRHGSVQAFTAAPPDGTNGGGDDGAASAQSKQTD
ncbi:uncharacterized protein C2845_PM06G03510 [Panicum miliaceum]|uniref:Uncharacterized protein n=1 Tax=Panicum miliaceum TaxID=4540 RepID=A0A3L6RD19_PANMI|nr:uncharacterized protein C2845_PM06G03510 [Panicum miliaceum]